jgi:FixJ family two-component response regulator
MPPARLIAVVDDDESIRETTKDLLESAGYRADAFASGFDLLAARDVAAFACVIADMRMPGMSGLELRRRLVDRGWPVPVIIVTAHPEERVRKLAADAGIRCYLAKPFTSESLLACVERACAETA